MVPEQWRWLYSLNPMVGVVDGFRWALLGTASFPGAALASSAACILLLLAGGALAAAEVLFDYLSAGSAAEGARLLVRTVPAAFGCEDCRCEFPAAIDPAQAAPGGAWDTTRCPECQGTRLSLVRGREFLIQDIEGQ